MGTLKPSMRGGNLVTIVIQAGNESLLLLHIHQLYVWHVFEGFSDLRG